MWDISYVVVVVSRIFSLSPSASSILFRRGKEEARIPTKFPNRPPFPVTIRDLGLLGCIPYQSKFRSQSGYGTCISSKSKPKRSLKSLSQPVSRFWGRVFSAEFSGLVISAARLHFFSSLLFLSFRRISAFVFPFPLSLSPGSLISIPLHPMMNVDVSEGEGRPIEAFAKNGHHPSNFQIFQLIPRFLFPPHPCQSLNERPCDHSSHRPKVRSKSAKHRGCDTGEKEHFRID